MIARKTVIAAVLLLLAGCARHQAGHAEGFVPMPGDLLYQDLDAGPLCDAIETVTEGVDGAKFSHVGMVSRVQAGIPMVIEAVGAGVVETPLDDFLARSLDEVGNPKVLVGRMEGVSPETTARAIDVARAFLGRPYDTVFVMDNAAFYCSELIHEAYRAANAGRPLFELAPMTFSDPATGQVFPAWKEYFADMGRPVPEGEPGLNPGGMSRSPGVRIIHAYGRPSGWRRYATVRVP